MNRNILCSSSLAVTFAALFSGAAQADHDWQYVKVKVLDIEPITRIIQSTEPRRVCTEQPVAVREERHSPGGAIIGTVIGAAIGHRIGHRERHPVLGTAVGAAVGASIGRAATSSRPEVRYETVERCHVEHERFEEERIVGYRVQYRYHGDVYETRTREHPGREMRMRVRIEPVE